MEPTNANDPLQTTDHQPPSSGRTMQQRLDRVGPVDAPEVVRVGRQVAEGLAAAHATDLIHRDIKPGNILLEGGQHKVRITDFGLARAADDASISQSGIIAGTPMYMAPEQALGQTLDQRADLFSLGSVLYQMVAGRPPFRANSAVAVLKRVAEDKPRAIREIIPETPQWLCDIIAKLHAKNRPRQQTGSDMGDGHGLPALGGAVRSDFKGGGADEIDEGIRSAWDRARGVEADICRKGASISQDPVLTRIHDLVENARHLQKEIVAGPALGARLAALIVEDTTERGTEADVVFCDTTAASGGQIGCKLSKMSVTLLKPITGPWAYVQLPDGSVGYVGASKIVRGQP